MDGISSILSVGGGLNALQSATLGINRGLQGLAQNAQTIAHANVEPDNLQSLTGAMVDSLQNRLAVELNAKMITTADQTLGTLLDVKV